MGVFPIGKFCCIVVGSNRASRSRPSIGRIVKPVPSHSVRVVIDSPAEFGRQVRTRRLALGLSQRDLALAVGTGERFIVELEAGKPTVQLGKALAAARGVGMNLIAAR